MGGMGDEAQKLTLLKIILADSNENNQDNTLREAFVLMRINIYM